MYFFILVFRTKKDPPKETKNTPSGTAVATYGDGYVYPIFTHFSMAFFWLFLAYFQNFTKISASGGGGKKATLTHLDSASLYDIFGKSVGSLIFKANYHFKSFLRAFFLA